MARYTWENAIETLQRADRGETTYEIGRPWSYCGYPTYRIDGWEFTIFDDCGEWDYIEQAIAPDGTVLETDGVDLSLWGYRPDGKLEESYQLQMKLSWEMR